MAQQHEKKVPGKNKQNTANGFMDKGTNPYFLRKKKTNAQWMSYLY